MTHSQSGEDHPGRLTDCRDTRCTQLVRDLTTTMFGKAWLQKEKNRNE